MFDKIFNKSNIIGAGLEALTLRNDVISNNIANVDNPNYKKKTVVFESMLSDAVDRYNETGKLDLSNVKPAVKTEHSGYRYRLDGNNVDIETEMVSLYTNSVKYDVLAGGVGYKSINLILSGIK